MNIYIVIKLILQPCSKLFPKKKKLKAAQGKLIKIGLYYIIGSSAGLYVCSSGVLMSYYMFFTDMISRCHSLNEKNVHYYKIILWRSNRVTDELFELRYINLGYI